MNILIVDDQPEVIKGIEVGVRWSKLHIDRIYTANDILEAQEIIRTHTVELMLCDIEMPLGTGLELYEWVIQSGYQIKCIFLTAHSEFRYAQKAVHLQGFDYLLQPVSYIEIENSLERAIDQIKIDQIAENYLNYGMELKRHEPDTLNNLLKDYLIGIKTDVTEVLDYMAVLSLPVEESNRFGSLFIEILSYDAHSRSSSLKIAMTEILEHLLGNVVQKMTLVRINNNQLYLIYVQNESTDAVTIGKVFGQFIGICRNSLQCLIACYKGREAIFSELPMVFEETRGMTKKNVLKKSQLFVPREAPKDEVTYVAPDLSRWKYLIQQKCYDSLRDEIFSYLDERVHAGNVNLRFLKMLHRDLIYLFFDMGCKDQQFSLNIYNDNHNFDYEAIMSSYTSLERIKNLVNFIINHLKCQEDQGFLRQTRIEEIESYLHNNIQKNITRKDVAEAVYLNPEYLSRLFKKEKGMTLSEYIVQEKMTIAENLLRTTSFSVSIVASKVGYTNFSHFAQSFKKVYGLSPSKLRKIGHKE